jgi:hypothetical protein
MNAWKTILFLSLTLLAGGCVTSSKILEVGKDTYSISATADGLSSASWAREKAFEAARLHCASLGKRFMLVNENVARTRGGIDTTVTITFRALDKDDPDYKRPNIQPTPDVVIEDKRN